MTNPPSRECRHENVGMAQDGSGVVVCWDCDEQYIPESSLRGKLDEMRLHEDLPAPFDQGYMSAWRDIREHFLGDVADTPASRY